MKQINTSININAPVATVWNILVNTNDYPQWNPFIKEIKGEFGIGNKIEVQIHPPNQGMMKFKPTVLNVEKEILVRWKGKLLISGLFDGTHEFRLEKINEQTTRFHHSETFNGILTYFIPLKNTEKGFVLMNEELKKLAEQH